MDTVRVEHTKPQVCKSPFAIIHWQFCTLPRASQIKQAPISQTPTVEQRWGQLWSRPSGGWLLSLKLEWFSFLISFQHSFSPPKKNYNFLYVGVHMKLSMINIFLKINVRLSPRNKTTDKATHGEQHKATDITSQWVLPHHLWILRLCEAGIMAPTRYMRKQRLGG